MRLLKLLKESIRAEKYPEALPGAWAIIIFFTLVINDFHLCGL